MLNFFLMTFGIIFIYEILTAIIARLRKKPLHWQYAYRCKGCSSALIDASPRSKLPGTEYLICVHCGDFFYKEPQVGRPQRDTHVWQWKENLDMKNQFDQDAFSADLDFVASKCEIDPDYKKTLLLKINVQA